jgi:hypothetical protein
MANCGSCKGFGSPRTDAAQTCDYYRSLLKLRQSSIPIQTGYPAKTAIG